MIQRLLEERPRTLARAYDLAHRYETTKRAAANVTRLMQHGVQATERRVRTTTVRECAEQVEDTGARRNVLTLRCYNAIEDDVKPPLGSSAVESLQGIGSENVGVCGEVHLPVQIGTRTVSVNFIVADIAEKVEAILGHPFLEQSKAYLDFGSQKIVLFGEQVPHFNPQHKPKVHVVWVARTTVLDSGREYIVPGYTRFREPARRDVMLNPTKGFLEKHCLLVARVVVDAQPNQQIPIRLYNPGTAPVKVKKGAIAGFLQAVDFVQSLFSVPSAEPLQASCTFPVVPPHLQPLYRDSAAALSADERRGLAQLLSSYGDVFSTGPTDLGCTSLVQHDMTYKLYLVHR
ncbi:hypothetical protein MHYP_G00226030 [Metynnis hypsauchen]